MDKKNMKFITANDIEKLHIKPSELYTWAETTIHKISSASIPNKIRMNFDNAEYAHFLPAALADENVLGCKVVTRSMKRTGGAIDADILLYKKNSLNLYALIDGTFITSARTAAVAVYTMFKAAVNYDVIAMVGLGNIGTLIGDILFDKIKEKKITVKLFKYKNHAERFIERFRSYENITFEIYSSYDELMRNSDVVFSCVSYIENDFCSPSNYKKGVTIIPVHLRGFMACDKEFDHIITSDLENVKNFKYYADFKRLSDWNDIEEGGVAVRNNPDERILIYYSGLGIYDILFAKKIFEKNTVRQNKTVIISCAGKGNRLGLGIPKALVDVCGKPLIIRQLELLDDISDVRIIVGYQADKVIETVQKYRRDVSFLFNNDYETTQTGASLSKGLENTGNFVVALDGDLLVHPDDMDCVLNSNEEVVCGTNDGNFTDNPVLMTVNNENQVVEFSRGKGTLEWSGLAQIKKDRFKSANCYVYQMLEPLLPVKSMLIRAKEIDTQHDYDNAVLWIQNGYTTF